MSATYQQPQTARQKININLNWKFNLGDITSGTPQATSYSDGTWKTVHLPHNFQDVPINGNQNYYRGIGWYRKHFTLDNSYQNKMITLYFCGAVSVATVYINGTALPVNYGGFHPFCFDITQYCILTGADNVIAVKLDNSSNTLVPPQNPLTDIDYNLFGGINKDVYLIVTDKVYVPEAIHSWSSGWADQGGQFVTFPSVSTGSATVVVKTWVKNVTGAAASCSLATCIVDSSNTVVQSGGLAQSVSTSGVTQFTQTLTVSSPRLWAPWSPYLYTVYSTVYNGTAAADVYSTRIGIRFISYDKSNGVSCNGTSFKILGLNRTNEWMFIGHATPNNQQKRDAATLREYGCNFARCSHYPMADAFYQGCDSVGLLLWVEMPSWHCCIAPSTDATWVGRCANEVHFMVRNGRNHPCVMVWGAGLNEGMKTAAFDTPQNDLCISEDSTRPTTAARPQGTDAPNNIYTFYGQNAFVPGTLPNANPDPNCVGYLNSEHTGHTFETHSIRATCSEQDLLDHATAHALMVTEGRLRPWCAGSVGWCCFDYYTNRSVSTTPYFKPHGVFDLMHIPKPAAYFYMSQSGGDNFDGSKHPMVKIANFYLANSPVDRRVYSNCQQVKLYQNDVLIAAKAPDTVPLYVTPVAGYPAATWNLAHPPFTFKNVAFVAGSLRAEGLIGGMVMARDTARTPGTAAGIKFIADPPEIEANGADISRIEVYIVDSNGTWIPDTSTKNAVSFSLVSGSVADGALIGDNPINAQAGACVVLAKAGLTAGTMTVQATGANLSSSTVVVTVKPSGIISMTQKIAGRTLNFLQHSQWIRVAGDHFTLPARKNLKTSLELFDVTGKLLKSGIVGKQSINLKKDFGLSSGVYLVRLDRM
jgi:Beta-galactosidase/beta-glucuronidase